METVTIIVYGSGVIYDTLRHIPLEDCTYYTSQYELDGFCVRVVHEGVR